MRLLLFLICVLGINASCAQSINEKASYQRKGLVIGLGIGGGSLHLNTDGTSLNAFSSTLPNIKLGYLVSKRLALMAFLPGATYRHKGKDRGFEGITLAAQYWVKERWWVLGGAGLTFDAPAFYTVSDLKSAGFYTGLPALTSGIGYEVYTKRRFSIDLQYRFFYGRSDISNDDFRKGFSNMFIIGFNWY